MITFAALNGLALVVAPRLAGTPTFVYRDARYNDVVMERFMLADRPFKVVLAGSSQLWVTPPDFDLPRGYFRLNFLGLGAGTALATLVSKEHVPDIVVVEVNFMNRHIQEGMLERYDSPEKRLFFRLFPIFRYEMHPGYFLSRDMDRFLTSGFERPERTPERLATQHRLVKRYLDGNALAESLDDYEHTDRSIEMIRELERRGSKVILLQMPFVSRLENRKSYQDYLSYVRSGLRSLPWVVFSAKEYFTNDGVHPFPGEGRAIFRCLQRLISIVHNRRPRSDFECAGASLHP